MTTAFTIILADRNRHVRALLARELAGEGYRVTSCGLGRDAAALAEAEGHVLVLDTDLPDMDVHGVVSRVRRARPGIPVVVHGHQPEEAGAALTLDDVSFVAKGADPSRLKQALGRLLQGAGVSGSGPGEAP